MNIFLNKINKKFNKLKKILDKRLIKFVKSEK